MTNQTTLTTLKSWLKAVNIDFKTSENAGLVVKTATGTEVCVVIGGASAEGAVAVNLDFGGRSLQKSLQGSLDAFQALQLALGYEARNPVDRGAIPEKKLANGEGVELTAMRHTEFRRCPNPTKAQIDVYKVPMENTTWRFFKTNTELLADHQMGIEDLKTYVLVWVTNFLGMYELADKSLTENKKLLHTYLSQRFSDLREYLFNQGRNVLPDLDDAAIALRGRPFNYTDKNFWEGVDTDLVPEPTEDDETLDLIEENRDLKANRSKANELLDTAFGAMEHGQLVEVLAGAAKNYRIDPEARKEAGRRLAAHTANCAECSALAEVQE